MLYKIGLIGTRSLFSVSSFPNVFPCKTRARKGGGGDSHIKRGGDARRLA